MLRQPIALLMLTGLACSIAKAQKTETLLLRSPSISQHQIAFNYAGDIWTTDENGQQPQRITVNPDVELEPMLSPDGKWIAFSGNYEGNVDIYVVSVKGGIPRRITYHPDADIVRGWHGNDKILFASTRVSVTPRFQQLFEVNIDGGMPVKLKMPEAHQGNISPDGLYTAYIKNPDPTERANTYRPFKHYRGGNMPRVWIFNNQTNVVTEIPHAGSNNIRPVWLGNDVYFLSDRNGTMNIFRYSVSAKTVTQVTSHKDYKQLNGFVKGKLLYRADNTLYSYDIAKRKSDVLMNGINSYAVSQNGEKLLYVTSTAAGITGTASKSNVGEGPLNIANIRTLVDPTAEWTQMFDELWRIERDFFYVDNMHGADWKAVKKKYQRFLPYVGHREDLNYLFNEMMSELVIGHNYVSQGDAPKPISESVGLLGADYSIENGHFRFKKIYSGLNWNPQFQAPLTQPGVNVKEGDYLLAVNGVPLDGQANVYSLFQGTAGRQVRILVNQQPDMTGAKEYTVVPVTNEVMLRHMNWIEGNRKKVDQLSNGKLAYIYMPNTGGDGYTYFNRYYFSQLDKKGVIIDERFNGGGSAADYVIDLLNRDLLNYWGTREGQPMTTPGNAIFGPKAMITNGYAGSGGDLMPFMFHEKKLGPLVGTTTMGILVGIYNYPQLMDGGFVTAPRLGIFSKDGKWIIENKGVEPDVEVEMTPADVIAGKDPQLEKTVELLMKELKDAPAVKKPAGPVRAE